MLSPKFHQKLCSGNQLRYLANAAMTLDNLRPEPRINSVTSTFSLRQRNRFNLVDKTAQLQHLLNTERKCFLSRPPRFGKTLMMTLLSSLFHGEKELFDGTVGRRLSIADGEWDWDRERHAVLSFNMGSVARRHNFQNSLKNALMAIAAQLGISDSIKMDTIKGVTHDLLMNAAKISPSGKLVILVDDADAPVSETLFMDETDDRPRILDSNSETLCDFFTEVENNDDLIRFQMYAGTGYFQFPGYIDDLTFDQSSLTLVGYTKDEIRQSFANRLQLLQEKLETSENQVDELIEDWYGGYNWGQNNTPIIHNPFAVNELMRKLEFGPHWSTAMESMLWLLGFISAKQIANPFQGKLPLMSRIRDEPRSSDLRKQAEDDVHLLLLKLGLLSIHSVELDESTMIRNGILGVPNM